MNRLPCSRTEMCSPCELVDQDTRKIICKTVQRIGNTSGYRRLDRIGSTSLMHLVAAEMESIIPGNLEVTGELIDRTVMSLSELTQLSKGI